VLKILFTGLLVGLQLSCACWTFAGMHALQWTNAVLPTAPHCIASHKKAQHDAWQVQASSRMTVRHPLNAPSPLVYISLRDAKH